jgi:hypothetical protein
VNDPLLIHVKARPPEAFTLLFRQPHVAPEALKP